MKTINNELIRSFIPCYDPSEKGIPDSETLPVREWVEKYRAVVPTNDIIWLLCHEKLLGMRDLRLFVVWCAREALKRVDDPDPRSVTACDVAERYAIGEATESEIQSAADAAVAAVAAAATRAATYAARAAARAAYTTDAHSARSAAYDARSAAAADAAACADTAREAQLEQLMTYFSY